MSAAKVLKSNPCDDLGHTVSPRMPNPMRFQPDDSPGTHQSSVDSGLQRDHAGENSATVALGVHGNFEKTVAVQAAAQFLGVSPSLVYAYVERKQIPHYRMMGRSIRFKLSELEEWRHQFHVNGGINE